MQTPAINLPDSLTWDWISAELNALWQPFLLGSLLPGVLPPPLASCLTMLFWRSNVRHSWRNRHPARSPSNP